MFRWCLEYMHIIINDSRACYTTTYHANAILKVARGQRAGPCISYSAAIHTKREVWMSEKFVRAEPALAKLVERLSMLDHSKWSIIASSDEFELVRKRAVRGKTASQVIGLVLPVEVAAIGTAFPVPFCKHVFVWDKCLMFVSSLDKQSCSTGIA